MEWKDIPESESPWEVAYVGGQDEWKEKLIQYDENNTNAISILRLEDSGLFR